MRACAIVAVGVLIGLAAGGGSCASGEGALREAADPSLWEGGSAGVSLQALDDATDPVEAPPSFEDEVLSLRGRAEARVDDRGGIVGFTVAGSADAAFQTLSSELRAKGWTSVQSGSATRGSFAKEEGSYRWAFASCVQSGDATCVVVQVVPTT